jgi:hypothetical protein
VWKKPRISEKSEKWSKGHFTSSPQNDHKLRKLMVIRAR